MSFSFRIFETIDDVPMADWDRARAWSSAPFFQDPRFIGAVEAGASQGQTIRHLVIYQDAAPVACASLTGITVDLATFADPRLASLSRRLPGVFSRFHKMKTLICGLPVSAGQSSVAFASREAAEPVISILDDIVYRLASDWKMHGVIYKEFAGAELALMDRLLDRGYSRVDTPPLYFFEPRFRDLQEYCTALRSNYRSQVKRSLRKLAGNNVSVSCLTSYPEIRTAYTPEVHSLYDQMVDRAEVKFERLPIAFFHELARRLDGEIELMVLSRDARILAFGWIHRDASACHLLFCGLDYALNSELDLYFNLFYATLDRALQTNVSTIQVGQTADLFKARVGCHPQRLYAFTKGVGPLMARLIRWTAPLLVARTPTPPAYDIFKRDAALVCDGQHAPARQVNCTV